MKKSYSFLLGFFFVWTIFIFPYRAGAAPHYPKPQGYVSDFANVIDPSSRQQLETQLADFERSTNNEIAVVTVPSLEGDTVENYAVELFKAWGIGKKGKDNGVLVLVAPNEHKVRIEVGYGLEAVLPDGLAGQIIRENMTPYFRQGQYGQGLMNAVGAIKTVASGQDLPVPAPAPSPSHPWGSTFQAVLPFLFFGFIAGFPFTVICLLLAIVLLSRTWAGFILLPLGFIFDMLFVRRRGGRFYNSGYYGGGFAGGGSSGGGGGFGGFGGGGSGGGGASGGW